MIDPWRFETKFAGVGVKLVSYFCYNWNVWKEHLDKMVIIMFNQRYHG